jgi:hypothetical protein
VITARNQIVSLRQQVKAEGNSGAVSGTPNPAYASLESIRAERQANLQSLQARRAAAEGKSPRSPRSSSPIPN